MRLRLPLVFMLAAVAMPFAAHAERVYVKARGEVDLAPFHCASVARSPNVKRLCYDEKQKYLLVSVKGIWYHYCSIPPAAVSAWRQSRAPGRHYNDHIRSGYVCEEGVAPSYR